MTHFGLTEKNKNTGEYSDYVGSYVRIKLSGDISEIGFIEKTTYFNIYLKPSLVVEGLTSKVQRRIETEIPTIVNTNFIV